ncbi:MAG: low molecular weight phosphotyrosine protein phosphatase [Mycobacterium sp.]|nr:low molecular weight phosphotyrosine protein phosphatase [Mycobacterium sp.]
MARRLLAEFVGTALLVTVVVGSGIAAAQLSPGEVGLQLLENSIATVFGLSVLILLFGPVSGAQFNPVVSAADWLLGRRAGTGVRGAVVLAYTVVQVGGGVIGAMLANLMFDRPVFEIAAKERITTGHLVGEVVATAGLVALIFALARTGRAALSAAAVGAYIGAAYWFTSSTSFANPAATVGRMFSDSFAGIAARSVPGFIAAQIVGALVGLALVAALYPDAARSADKAVVPHHTQEDDQRSRSTAMTKPTVLFLCTHNAGRSQMALGFLTRLAGDRAVAYSGGSEPADHVNPTAVAAMAEKGIDITAEHPKLWTDEMLHAADIVVTMGCGDTCPVIPGRRYEEWPLPDPAGQPLEAVRPIRDEIEKRVFRLLTELGVEVGSE